MTYWKDKRVLVTGGAGFIGSHLVKRLVNDGAKVIGVDNLSRGRLENLSPLLTPKTTQFRLVRNDLTDKKQVEDVIRPGLDYVFHLAAHLGGVGYMNAEQAKVFTPNVLMNTLVLDRVREIGIKNYLFTSTACVYNQELQKDSQVLLQELAAYPSWPDATYGWTKLLGEIQCLHYSRDYGIDIKIPRMFNVYGPNEDFSIERSHVIPSLMRKAYEYPKEPFIVWGDGSATRAFLYVDDAVDGLMRMAEIGPNAEPVNIGSDKRVTVKELAEMIIEVSGKDIEITFDASKPEGVHGRAADWSKAEKLLGWRPGVPLEYVDSSRWNISGLKATWDWYVGQQNAPHP